MKEKKKTNTGESVSTSSNLKDETNKKVSAISTASAAGLGVAATSAALASLGLPASAGITTVGIFAATLLAIHQSLPVNKKTAPVEPVSETWKTRPKANLVKWLMKQSGLKLETVAEYLGCSVSYLNTKLARDSFSFEDLIVAAYACGYTFVLVKNDEAIDYPAVNRVDLVTHFENSEPEVLERINAIEEGARTAKLEEYERKKTEIEQEYKKKMAELERLKEEYGIED